MLPFSSSGCATESARQSSTSPWLASKWRLCEKPAAGARRPTNSPPAAPFEPAVQPADHRLAKEPQGLSLRLFANSVDEKDPQFCFHRAPLTHWGASYSLIYYIFNNFPAIRAGGCLSIFGRVAVIDSPCFDALSPGKSDYRTSGLGTISLVR